VTTRSLRRRIRQWAGSRDWLGGVLTGIGLLLLVLSVVCMIAVVVVATSLGDEDRGFSLGSGALGVSKWFGLVLFTLFALLSFAAGWFLVGERVRGWVRSARRPG
jgi:hypothetical protein